MRILFINQFFPPDLAPTGQLLADVTAYLSEQGHDVSVICSETIYAPGGLPSVASVTIYRLKGFPFRRTLIGRSASYLTFLFEALRTVLRIEPVDVIVTLTTPPLLALVGAVAKRVRGCRFFTWEMDLFPESLVTMGLLTSNSIATGFLRKLASVGRRRADGIIVLGSCMRDALIAQKVPPSRIQVAENWSKPTAVLSPLPKNAWITIFYSGNLGASHDTDTILAAMALLQSDFRFRFVFAGGGVKRKLFENRCRELGLTHVRFAPYVDGAEYASRLQNADIGLVTQTDASLGAVVPSKLYSLMACGRPVLFVGPAASAVARSIESNRCGWHVPCGASAQLVTLLHQLVSEPLAIATAGSNAYAAYLRQHTPASGTGRIAAALGLNSPAKTQVGKAARAGS